QGPHYAWIVRVNKNRYLNGRSRLEVVAYGEGYRTAEQRPRVVQLANATRAYVGPRIALCQSDFVREVVDVELCSPLFTQSILDPRIQLEVGGQLDRIFVVRKPFAEMGEGYECPAPASRELYRRYCARHEPWNTPHLIAAVVQGCTCEVPVLRVLQGQRKLYRHRLHRLVNAFQLQTKGASPGAPNDDR